MPVPPTAECPLAAAAEFRVLLFTVVTWGVACCCWGLTAQARLLLQSASVLALYAWLVESFTACSSNPAPDSWPSWVHRHATEHGSDFVTRRWARRPG